MKTCTTAGCSEEQLSYNSRCREHYNAYMAEYMLARYHRRRAEYIAELGGFCVDCGTDEDLEFDHADSSTKKFDVGKMLGGYSDKRLREELAKCVLRCHPCHVAKSNRAGDWRTVEHGGGLTGKKNCRCDLCGPLKREYKRARYGSLV